MRDELIEVAARSISRKSGWPDDMWDNPEDYSTSATAKEAYVAFATAALDTILIRLADPSEDMIEKGAEEYGKDVMGADHLDLEDAASRILKAMLSTLTAQER